jgi:hypothetical protein
MTRRAWAFSLGAVLVVVGAGHLSLFPRVADLDGFYHIGHAAAYLEGSVFDTSLPWATQSVIREHAADLWWGFHVLLTPFAVFDEPAVGIRLAAFILTLSLGLTALQVLVRHGVPNAGWWAAGFLVAVPNIFFRYLMLRPHVLSLAASVALLSTLVRGRWWQVAALSALIAWVHLNLFWVAPAILVAYAVAHVPITIGSEPDPDDRSVPVGPAFAAVLGGTLAGWLLRPNPVATAALLNVQLVELFTLKATNQPITFAAELQPIGLAELTRTTWLFLGAWIAAGAITSRTVASGVVAKVGRERATLLVASLLISIAFLSLATLAARRAMEQWVAFGFLTLPIVWTFLIPIAAGRRRAVRIPAVVVVTGYLAWGGWRHSLNVEQVAFPGDTLAEVARFLESNSEPGEIVFHPRWDNFGPLLAHNRTNHYLGGMDPIFQLAYDHGAYWEFFHLSTDLNVDWTCDAFPCSDGVATDSYLAIRDHFGARWVLVEPRRNPRLALELLNDGRYELALETEREAVFEVLPDTAVMEGG